jgi:hypothetical protein
MAKPKKVIELPESINVTICCMSDSEWKALKRSVGNENRMIDPRYMLWKWERVLRDSDASSIDNRAMADLLSRLSFNLKADRYRIPRDMWYRISNFNEDVLSLVKEFLQDIADVPVEFIVLDHSLPSPL